MILLVPVSPEVPIKQEPKFWPGLVLVLFTALAYLVFEPTVLQDKEYLERFKLTSKEEVANTPNIDKYLQYRPLLNFAPAHGDWNISKLIIANFIHGSKSHLLLNLIGLFAGARICSTFLPFFWTVFVFLIGGSLGLLVSVLAPPSLTVYAPHVGASAGVFALMGTYYIYNFLYRTRYFFWFPWGQGKIALPTSWFFFFDVLLLELVLSAAYLLPTRIDDVDHAAHVSGFLAGTMLAVFLRFIQRWPSFIQTRSELDRWLRMPKPRKGESFDTQFHRWIQCLLVNPFNDRVKEKIFAQIRKTPGRVGQQHLEQLFPFMRPTYCRRHARQVASLIELILDRGHLIPLRWLQETPYDVIIRLASVIASEDLKAPELYRFIAAYREAIPPSSPFYAKITLLLVKLETEAKRVSPSFRPQNDHEIWDENENTAGAGNSLRKERAGSRK